MSEQEKKTSLEKLFQDVESLSLKDISDDALSLCLQLANDNRLKYEIDTSDDGKKLIFRTNINRFCSIYSNCKKPLSINEMIMSIGGKDETSKPFFLDNAEDGLGLECNPMRMAVCDGCQCSECPTFLLEIILILKERGVLSQKLSERNKSVGYFKFNWEPEDGLKNVPENIFNLAKNIFDNKMIWVAPKLNEGGKINISSYVKCSDIHTDSLDNLTKQIAHTNNASVDLNWYIYKKPSETMDSLCGDLECRLSHCPLLVAAYLYYLSKTNQYDKVNKHRQYYHEHEDDILRIAEENVKRKIDEYLSSQIDNTILSKFDHLQSNVENLDLLSRAVSNIKRNNFCFAIEREEGVDDSKLIELVEESLIAQNKIDGNATKLTLDELDSLIINDEVKDETLYVAGSIYSYNKTKSSVVNLGKFIDFLCSSKKNTYLLIVGTREELSGTDGLFAIDPKVKYVYEHFKVSIHNLSIDKLFEIYKNNLDPIIIEQLNSNESEARTKFDDFVLNNRSIFPFKNEELSLYLARYSNSCGGLVFPPYAYKFKTLDESLKSIVGLKSVKTKMKELEKYILFKNKAKAMNAKLPTTNLHMLFNGNPGTGKTTMARIMTRMLYDIGAIKENKLIEVERKDLIGQYIGQTAPKTAEAISKAIGGVLFIDEAYTLTPKSESDYGHEAIATLIKAMEDHKDELVVILAGYEDEMRQFVNANPGIASRIGYTFDFEDYSVEELLEILKLKLKANGFTLSDDFLKNAKDLIEIGSKKKNFGNGRFVDRVIQEVLMKHSTNTDIENILTISENDLPTIEQLNGETTTKGDVKGALDNLIGMSTLKQQVYEFIDYVEFVKRAKSVGLDVPSINMNMLFTGNPGTGKTTIARIMAKMLYDIGIIHENKLVETERKDLIGEYVGQTAPKTSDIINKAMGGVLFIDEAYTLTPKHGNDFGHEAIATLIKAMEDHKGEFIVIFAGYQEEMREFVDANPGIASRVGYTFHFPDYNSNELLQIYQLKMRKSGFTLTDAANDNVLKIMKYFSNVDNIGNGRFVDRVIQNTMTKHAKSKPENLSAIDLTSIPTIDEIIQTLTNASSMLNPGQVNDASMRKTAIHEVGHAYLRYKLYSDPQIVKITINAEGSGTLGYVQFKGDQKATHNKTELLNDIKVLLAGMGSEEVFNGEFENGNTSDLEKATSIARNMVTRYGMSRLGVGQMGNEPGLAVSIQNEINHILNECYKQVKELIRENKEDMKKLIVYLLKHKELTGEEFMSVVEGKEVKK